jgi:hypothetical protein
VNPQRDRIKLYGALPAYKEMHDMDKIVKFVSPSEKYPTGLVPDYRADRLEQGEMI